jgi:hypothetical protein
MSSRRAFTARMITTIVVAGAFATLFFELFGQTLSPLLGALPTLGPKLPPAAIMNQAIAGVTGMDGAQVSALGLGYAGHLAAKMIVYPAVWMIGVRPLYRRFAPRLRALGAATLYGVVLWVFSLYAVAHLMAGAPAFLGFTDLAWTALWAHILYAWIVAAIVWAPHALNVQSARAKSGLAPAQLVPRVELLEEDGEVAGEARAHLRAVIVAAGRTHPRRPRSTPTSKQPMDQSSKARRRMRSVESRVIQRLRGSLSISS